jgi:hypothetical protein
MSKPVRHRLLFAGVGVLLILLGLRGVVLQIAGKSAQATVTEVKRAVSRQDDKMDHNYRIAYRFAVNGKDYTGMLTRKKVYNIATLPSVGTTLAIRYLASAPAINGGANEGVLGGLVLGALGVVLFVAGVLPRKPTAREIPPADAQTDTQS